MINKIRNYKTIVNKLFCFISLIFLNEMECVSREWFESSFPLLLELPGRVTLSAANAFANVSVSSFRHFSRAHLRQVLCALMSDDECEEFCSVVLGEISAIELRKLHLPPNNGFVFSSLLIAAKELRDRFGTVENLRRNHTADFSEISDFTAKSVCSVLCPPIPEVPTAALLCSAMLQTVAEEEQNNEEKMENRIRIWQKDNNLTDEELAKLFSTRISVRRKRKRQKERVVVFFFFFDHFLFQASSCGSCCQGIRNIHLLRVLLRLGFDSTAALEKVPPGMQETGSLLSMIMCVNYDVKLMRELLDFPYGGDGRLERLNADIRKLIQWGHPEKSFYAAPELIKFLKSRGFDVKKKQKYNDDE